MAMIEILGNVASLRFFLPELILCAGMLIALLAGLFAGERRGFDWPTGLSVACLVLAFVAHLQLYGVAPKWLFRGTLALDGFAVFFKGFFLLAGLVTVLISAGSSELSTARKGEYNAILIAIVLGMSLVAASSNLLMLYLSVELMSLGSYVLVGFAKEGRKTDEAAIKYILYGAMSTGVMLFGMSLLFGLTGTVDLHGPEGIAAKLFAAQGNSPLLLFAAFLLLLVGVGYKIAAVPFHFWCPDVYEGAPTPITAFLSVASKGTGFALLLRLFYQSLVRPAADGQWLALEGIDWVPVMVVISILTMTLGNLSALHQQNMKRLLAYSSIAHAGYVLMGAAALTTAGIEAMLFYLLMYLFTNLAAFTVVILLIDRENIHNVRQYQGLWKRNFPLAALMAIVLLSLTGVPPTAGFLGKYYLFMAVIHAASGNAWFWLLAFVAAMNTVISCYYYFRIVRAMFLEEPTVAEPIQPNPLGHGIAWVLTAAILALFFVPGAAYEYIRECSRFIQ